MKKIIFVTHENFERTAVAKAMLYDLIAKLPDDWACKVFSASDTKCDCIHNDIENIYFKRNRQGVISLRDFLFLLMAIKKLIRSLKDVSIVYVRSYPMMFLFFLYKLFGKKIIFDTRGLFFEELFDSGKLPNNFLLRRIFIIIEYVFIKVSDTIICVSDSQAEYYKEMCRSANTRVIYNGAEISENIKDVRCSDKIIIGYVGSLIDWHCPYYINDFLSELKRAGVKFVFHCVTRDISRAEEVFIGNYEKEIYSHDYRYNPIRFDLGLCFISDTLSKKVCFPVKFSEYISSGTPVIFSNNVDAIKILSNNYGLGVGLDLRTPVSEMVFELKSRNVFKKLETKLELPNELTTSYMVDSICDVISEL